MKRPLVLLALLAGCATLPAGDPLPAFPRIDAAKLPSGERIFLLAGLDAELVRRGPCLGVGRGADFRTIIWPETARIGRDRRGIYAADRSSGARVHLGDRIVGGGGNYSIGSMEDEALDMQETGSFDPACLGVVFGLNPGFRSARF